MLNYSLNKRKREKRWMSIENKLSLKVSPLLSKWVHHCIFRRQTTFANVFFDGMPLILFIFFLRKTPFQIFSKYVASNKRDF